MNKPKPHHYTKHALERALERMFGLSAPYTQIQLDNMRVLLDKLIIWHDIRCTWVVEEFDVRLAMTGEMVTTVLRINDYEVGERHGVKEYEKLYTRKLSRGARNINYKGKRDD